MTLSSKNQRKSVNFAIRMSDYYSYPSLMTNKKMLSLFSMLFISLAALAQKQFFLPTAASVADEQDKPMIEVYLPKNEVANGCAVVLCPGGAMRWLSWESDVVKMTAFLNEHGIAAIGLRYHLNKAPMPQGMKMPPMVDVTHPEAFPQADANPMHNEDGDSIIRLAAMDAKAAIRMVREKADEWNISKEKIGLTFGLSSFRKRP